MYLKSGRRVDSPASCILYWQTTGSEIRALLETGFIDMFIRFLDRLEKDWEKNILSSFASISVIHIIYLASTC